MKYSKEENGLDLRNEDQAPAMKVLLVNDDPVQLELLSGLAAKAGLQSVSFTGVEAALAAMNPDCPPALIVTDLYMPGIDGWRFCRLLRSPEYAFCNEIPILVVSATFAGAEPESIAADIGADVFLPAPVDGREFIASLKKLLQGKDARRLPRVLIVEDSRSLSELLINSFSVHGYLADGVSTVREAEAALSGVCYDLAVLDYHLPDGTGDSLLEPFLARRPEGACIMMTTDTTPELALEWMKRGAAAYLRKPFQPEYLIEMCARVRRERALFRLEDLLEERTRELRNSEAAVRSKLQAVLEPESDLGILELADIIDIPAVQSLMEDFRSVTGLASAIVDDKGDLLVAVGFQEICTKFHRSHPETLKNCVESDTVLARGAATGTFKTYRCRNGLWDMASPIEVAGRHLGNIFFGQFIYADEIPDLELFRERARRCGFAEADYLAALDRVPRYDRQTVERVMSFYSRLAGMISSLSFSTVSLSRALNSQKHAQSKLSLQAQVLDQIQDLVTVTDLDGIITYVNNASARTLGYQRRELIGRRIEKFGQDPDRGATQKEILEETLRKGSWRGQVINFSVDGREIILDCRTQVVLDDQGQRVALAGITTDITELKKAMEKLRSSELQLANAANIAKLGPWELDVESGIFTFNDAFYAVFRTNAEREGGYLMSMEEYGKRFLFSEDIPKLADETQKALESDDPSFSRGLEHRIRYADGQTGYISVRYFVIKGENGRTIKTYGVNQDITERLSAENALRESEARLNLALQVARMGYWRYDCATQGVEWSRGHEVLFGIPFEKFAGTLSAVQELVHPEDREQGAENLRRALEEEVPFDNTYRVIHPDGSIHWLHSHGLLYKDCQGRHDHIFGVTQDVTELRTAEEERIRLQSQLFEAQKLDSVGRLAGGIAHDFNNMLGVILGRTEMLLERNESDRVLQAELKEIQKAAERSADLTRQLLAFARKQTITPRVLDLNETVESMLKMLRRLIGEDIDLVWRPGKKKLTLKIDPSQIDQLLVNLCVNSRDAINRGGRIIIETDRVMLYQDCAEDHPGFEPGEYVLLAIADNGCGMDPEILAHIFEPFFTSKEVGQGTGLGLSIVYGLVSQNNGHIRVSSQPGLGTTFKIFFPLYQAGKEVSREKTAATRARRGSETVMLVEDEPAILRMTALMLERLGYQVLAVRLPGEAVRLAQECGSRIDLLLTDVVMPELNGRELAKRIQRFQPDIKCLFMSGYTADVIAHQGVLDESVHFIQKPFSMEGLGAKLRDVLE